MKKPKPPDEGTNQPYWTKDVKDPHDPVGRMKLGSLMAFDRRASYRHRILWEFHLSWAHQKYGWTSLASARVIAAELRSRDPSRRGMSLRHISEGNRDLCSWGYLTELEHGAGTRATRYAVNWGLLALADAGQFASVSPVGNSEPPVSHVGNATVSPEETQGPSGAPHVGNEDSATLTRRQTGSVVESSSNTHHRGTGLSAVPNGGIEDFDRLYDTYGVRLDRAKARAAFERLAPDGSTIERMLEAAVRWRRAYDAEGRTTDFRKRLATWLAGECWLEDGPAKPRIPRSSRSGNATATKKAKETESPPATTPAAPTMRTGTIGATRLIETETDTVVVLSLMGADGPFEHRVYFKDDDKRQLARLCLAAGKPEIEDTDELVGCRITIEHNADGCRFAPAPANDNEAGAVLELSTARLTNN